MHEDELGCVDVKAISGDWVRVCYLRAKEIFLSFRRMKV
jgi:hypothetical protein